MDFEVTKDIFAHLQDEMSRTIFEKRVMYSLTGDGRYLVDMIRKIPQVQHFLAQLKMSQENYLFGAGIYGERFLAITGTHRWAGVLDNNEEKWGTEIHGGGMKVYPPEILKNHPNAMVFVDIRFKLHWSWEEIEEQLNRLGVVKEHIIRLDEEIMDLLDEAQYFDVPEVGHSDHEVFVDAGCLHGETSVRFVNWAGGVYDHIYAFEPDPASIEQSRKTLEKISKEKTTLFPYGMWKERNELHFSKIGIWSSLTEGDISIPVTSIDHELQGKRVTIIKMDIEGAELAALQGAKKTIREQHPRLIICVYHKPEDIIEIPAYILSLCPDYKFYLRHYSLRDIETVLYAV